MRRRKASVAASGAPPTRRGPDPRGARATVHACSEPSSLAGMQIERLSCHNSHVCHGSFAAASCAFVTCTSGWVLRAEHNGMVATSFSTADQCGSEGYRFAMMAPYKLMYRFVALNFYLKLWTEPVLDHKHLTISWPHRDLNPWSWPPCGSSGGSHAEQHDCRAQSALLAIPVHHTDA